MATEKFRMVGAKPVIDKDPNAVLDYTVDFSKIVNPLSDSITTATALGTGVVVDSVTHTATTVTAWVSGGTLTVGSAYASVVFSITTVNSPARKDDRTLYFNIKNR